MPNKWVQFVKKWSAENNMNYMCAMTTKECKEAYLKEHPKPEKKTRPFKSKYGLNKSDDVDLLLNEISDMEFGSPFLNDIAVENKIREIAKKHKIDISKFGEDEDGSMVENVLEGVRYGKSKKVSAFFEDFYDLIQSVKERAEGREMGKEDVPAPAPPAKKVKVVVRKKKAVLGETDQQEDLMKLMAEEAKKGGVPEFVEPVVLRKLPKAVAPKTAPDRSKVQMELVKMGQKAKDVAEKRANIQMELSEIGKKAKLKEAQKEAQKYLATKGMANKAKQMAVEKEQVREEAKEKVVASNSDLIAELRKMIEGKKLYDIGQAKTKDAIQSLSKKQGFGFSGGVYKSFGGRGAMLSPSEMIENALTVLEKGRRTNEGTKSFLTELVDFVKSSLDELKEKEDKKAEREKAKKSKTKSDAPNTALSRFQEAETNPALKVLTNSDLLKMIGSFTKGMEKPYTAVKGIRGKLRDDLLDFFRPIFQTPEYKIRYKGDPPPTDDVNDGEIDFLNAGGVFKWKDILNMVKLITLQTNKYTQKDFGYENRYTIGNMMIMLFHNKGVGDVLKVEKRSPTGLWKDTERVEIPIPMKIKDSKFRYDSFVLDPNA